jgi:hypothetical protein
MARAPRKFLLLIAAAASLLFGSVVWLTAPQWTAKTTSNRGARSVTRATTPRRAAWQLPPVTETTAETVVQPPPAPAPARPDEELSAPPTPPSENAAPENQQQRPIVVEQGVRSEPNPRESALRQKLETITAQHTAAKIAFVRCEGEDCRARVEILEAEEADKFVAAARRATLGAVEIRMRERITAFNGRTYQADMKISGEGRSM